VPHPSFLGVGAGPPRSRSVELQGKIGPADAVILSEMAACFPRSGLLDRADMKRRISASTDTLGIGSLLVR
jgi:hypothetical protein